MQMEIHGPWLEEPGMIAPIPLLRLVGRVSGQIGQRITNSTTYPHFKMEVRTGAPAG
jgi:hypothetical protein